MADHAMKRLRFVSTMALLIATLIISSCAYYADPYQPVATPYVCPPTQPVTVYPLPIYRPYSFSLWFPYFFSLTWDYPYYQVPRSHHHGPRGPGRH